MAGRPRIPAVPCKHCRSSDTRGNGKTKAGSARYYCNVCKKSWTDNPLPHPKAGGRKPKYLSRPLSNAEHQALWRRQNKIKRLRRQNKAD